MVRDMALTTRTIKTLIANAEPGMWSHQRGLYLVVSVSGTASWALRYSTSEGKRRLMTLDVPMSSDAASLKAVELEAIEIRKAIRAGIDPLVERHKASKVASVPPRGEGFVSFENEARDYIAQHKPEWKNGKHAQQWENTLETYVYPLIGSKACHEITTADTLSVLKQSHERAGRSDTLWANARETATRVRSRIEIIISAARARGIADPETKELWLHHHNPAQWRGHLSHLLSGKQIKGHFAALDFVDAPTFYQELRCKQDISARALALTILCATRTSETLNATWDEFDLDAAIWTIPASRMKASREHRVPLSSEALEVIQGTYRIEGNPYVFPGAKKERPLSQMAMLEMVRGMRSDGVTVHGFRSCFRDWITETTLHPDTVAEQALAHTIENKVERAYRRGDALERRRALMQQWADYLTMESASYLEKWERLLAIDQ